MQIATANPANETTCNSIQTTKGTKSFLLTPPKGEDPVVVRAHFELTSLNAIHDEMETFEFTGTITLKWNDPRQAFDPAMEGVNEKIFQGPYQVKELSASWYPVITLVNRSSLYEKDEIVLRIKPDGTSILTETLNTSVMTKFNMVRFPFDQQRLEIIFDVLGLNANEVLMQAASDMDSSLANLTNVPQWIITEASESVRERSISYNGHQGSTSEFVVSLDVYRDSFYLKRLVIIPLIIIVLLTFSVFWMDKSSIGDRLNVSFIGILTGVSYQILISDQMPSISYFTFMNGFLSLSFFATSATVIISLLVNSLDRHNKNNIADHLDRRCRWAFPLGYFVLIFILDSVTRMML